MSLDMYEEIKRNEPIVYIRVIKDKTTNKIHITFDSTTDFLDDQFNKLCIFVNRNINQWMKLHKTPCEIIMNKCSPDPELRTINPQVAYMDLLNILITSAGYDLNREIFKDIINEIVINKDYTKDISLRIKQYVHKLRTQIKSYEESSDISSRKIKEEEYDMAKIQLDHIENMMTYIFNEAHALVKNIDNRIDQAKIISFGTGTAK